MRNTTDEDAVTKNSTSPTNHTHKPVTEWSPLESTFTPFPCHNKNHTHTKKHTQLIM